jgi:hypothetical protein
VRGCSGPHAVARACVAERTATDARDSGNRCMLQRHAAQSMRTARTHGCTTLLSVTMYGQHTSALARVHAAVRTSTPTTTGACENNAMYIDCKSSGAKPVSHRGTQQASGMPRILQRGAPPLLAQVRNACSNGCIGANRSFNSAACSHVPHYTARQVAWHGMAWRAWVKRKKEM